MGEIPHLVKVHEKYGKIGFNVVGVSNEAPSTLETFIKSGKGKEMNYCVVNCGSQTTSKDYEVGGYPTCYLIGMDGKFLKTGSAARTIADSEIDSLVSQVVPKKVGREVEKDVKKAAELFDKGEIGACHKEVAKFTDAANAEKYSTKSIEDAKFIADLIEKTVAATVKGIERLEDDKDYLAIQANMPVWLKRFKGHPLEETLKEKEKTLKTKEVKKEIAAQTAFEKHKVAYSKADDKGKAAMKPAIEKFIKDNEGTRAAEKAKEMIGG